MGGSMAEVNLMINGRSYSMECDDGQQQRVTDLGRYVDGKVRQIARAGGASSDQHLMFLAALMIADEAMEMRDHLSAVGDRAEMAEHIKKEEMVITQAIDHLAKRIDTIADRLQKA